MIGRIIGGILIAVGIVLGAVLVANADSAKPCNPIVSQVESEC